MEQDAMIRSVSLVVVSFCCSLLPAVSQSVDPLSFHFSKKYGQIEVGGPFAGVEFHQSRPLPSRISFYYPVANSIDLSKDYWMRYESMPMALGIKIGDRTKEWIGREGWEYILSPHSVTFLHVDSILSYKARYEFCRTEPAMVVSFEIKNESTQQKDVTAYSHLLLALRTCQTFARKDSSHVTLSADRQTIVAEFTDPDTRSASVFVANAGVKAVKSWCDANELSITDDGKSTWFDSSVTDQRINDGKAMRTRSAAAFEYKKGLAPGEVLKIVLIIGSTGRDEVGGNIENLSKNWMDEIRSYDEKVRHKASNETYFVTGDQVIDRTLQWSKALLTTNAHYLDGHIVPMPCPAEYNFFFTHDLLMTNLGAVNFDPERVKNNLLYVASLAQDSIIPHAYYWRDDGFKTELCTPSNWNHLWFIEVSASYLRHTLDTATIRKLYPLVTKSMKEMMLQLRGDHLMYAFRPDWWDIGWNEGPRTYITALGIRQIENYLFIASMIDRKNPSLIDLENTTIAMRSALVEALWDDSLNYLINFNGQDKDHHLYMGSLLAPAFRLLDVQRSGNMIETVKKELLAHGVGVRAAMPADFHTDSSIAYFKFAGKEAGDAYTYINGGVWPHNNAWYALALNATGRTNEAKEFVKQTMTIDGVAQSPNGIPAMYEYRYSNVSSPRYGEIDKPSFLWAGGFYLYTLYTIAGMNDNVWNLSFSDLPTPFDSTVRCSYAFTGMKDVEISGSRESKKTIRYDGATVPSLVIPLENRSARTISVARGDGAVPYIKSATVIVHSAKYSGKKLTCIVSSFRQHRSKIEIVSSKKPSKIYMNGKIVSKNVSSTESDGSLNTTIAFSASENIDTIMIQW